MPQPTRTSNRFFVKPSLALACISLAQPLFAHPLMADSPNVSDAESTSEDIGVIDEIVVSATRSEQSSFRIPGSVTVISKEEIDDLVASSISDLFVSVPSVQFTGGPRRNGEVPSIRGVSGEGVLILFDGVRQNFLSGHDGRFFIDPSLLRTAEVVRGPNSSLYGAGAFGGVIAFETLNASDVLGEDDQMALTFRSGFQGVNDEFSTGVNGFIRSENGRFDGVASITFRESDDISLGDGTSLNAEDEIGAGFLKTQYQATKSTRLEAQWTAYRGTSIEPNNGQSLNTGDLVDKDIKSNTLRLGLSHNPLDQDLVDLTVIGYSTTSSVDEAELDSDRVISRTVETLGFVADNKSRFTLNDRLSGVLTLGAEVFTDKQVGTDNTSDDGTRGGVPNAQSDTLGAFAQLETTLTTENAGTLLFISSVRYDSFNNKIDDATTGTQQDDVNIRLGLTWQPQDWFLIYGAYGEAFRAPSFNEVFADGIHFQIPLGPFVTAPNFFIPNLDLQPEESETIEFGVGLDFKDLFLDDDRFTLKGGYYTADVSNLIDLEVNFAFSPQCFGAPIPGPCTSGTSQNVNAVNATLEGFELEAGYTSPLIFAQVSYSAITGRDKTDNSFVGVLTPDRLNINAGLTLFEDQLRLGYRLEANGAFKAVNSASDRRKGFERLDLYASYQPKDGLFKGIRLDVGVDNVTDSTFERVFAGVTEPGANWKMSASWTHKF